MDSVAAQPTLNHDASGWSLQNTWHLRYRRDFCDSGEETGSRYTLQGSRHRALPDMPLSVNLHFDAGSTVPYFTISSRSNTRLCDLHVLTCCLLADFWSLYTITMSPRSRHSPLQAASKPSHGSRSTVPRHQAVPDSSAMSFAKSSLNSEVMHSHYALTSSTSGSRHQHDAWNTASNRMPKDTDLLPLNGYESMHYIDPYSTNMMTTSDPMEIQYNLAAGENLSRHAVSAATVPGAGDIMMNDFMSLDFVNCDAMLQDQMDTSSWPYGLPSPPRDDELFQDQAIVEDLGPSKLLPYRLE